MRPRSPIPPGRRLSICGAWWPDAKIAADAGWAVGLRPKLLELRAMNPEARKAAYAGVIAEIER